MPVFWMATEDHDYEEIKSTTIFGKKLTWETNQIGCVGDFCFDKLDGKTCLKYLGLGSCISF